MGHQIGMEYYERMVCVHRPHSKEERKKERKKEDEEKIDEKTLAKFHNTKHPTKQKGENWDLGG